MAERDAPAAGKFKRACEDIRWLSDRLAGLTALATDLERVTSIEALAEKAKAELEHYQREEARIRESLTVQAILKTNADAKAILTSAQMEADRIVQGANRKRDTIIEQAQTMAVEIVGAATDKAAGIEANLAAARQALAAAGA